MFTLFLIVTLALTAFMLLGAHATISQTGWDASDKVFVPAILFVAVGALYYLTAGAGPR